MADASLSLSLFKFLHCTTTPPPSTPPSALPPSPPPLHHHHHNTPHPTPTFPSVSFTTKKKQLISKIATVNNSSKISNNLLPYQRWQHMISKPKFITQSSNPRFISP
ncbi:hypothetical protein Hanom_Chr07g00611661 [Helianthus anomalus]